MATKENNKESDINRIRKLVEKTKTELSKQISSEIRPETSKKIDFMSFAEILKKPEDITPPVIDGILYPKQAALFTGPTGIGKSIMFVEAILSLAAGKPFLDKFDIKKSHRILLLQAENDFRTFRERLNTMTHDWSGSRRKALENILTPWINGGPQISGPLSDRFGKPTSFLESVKTLIEETKPNILFLDPLISFHGGDENDNSIMRKALDNLTNLANEHDLTLFLTHHHGKARQKGVHNSRGASAITDWASVILTLNWKRNRSKDRTRNRHIIQAEWTKVRSFVRPEPVFLELIQGATFKELEDGRSIIDVEPNDIARLIEDSGGRVDGTINLTKKIQDTFNTGRQKAEKKINQAVREGIISKKKDPSDKRRVVYSLPDRDGS